MFTRVYIYIYIYIYSFFFFYCILAKISPRIECILHEPVKYFTSRCNMTCMFTAGDCSTTTYDAEIHSMYSDKLYVYRSDFAGSTLITSSHSVKTAMLIRLSRMQMYATNYEGYNYYRQETGLFAFDTMYMGLNRVVDYIHGSASAGRTGRGMCSVCIYFLKDTVEDLHGYRCGVISDSIMAKKDN